MENELKHQIWALEAALQEACLSSDFSESPLPWQWLDKLEERQKIRLAADLSASLREKEKRKLRDESLSLQDLPHEPTIPADAIATLEFVARFSVIDRYGKEANIAFNANRNKCFIRTSDKFFLIGLVKQNGEIRWEIIEYDVQNRRGCVLISCSVCQVRPYADELETSNGLLAFLAANFSLRRPYWRLDSKTEDVHDSLDIDKATPDIKLLASTLQRYGFLIRLTATYSSGKKQYQIEFSDSALGEVRIEKDFFKFYLINNYRTDYRTEIEEWAVSEDQAPVKVLEWLISKNGGIPSKILDARERVVCLFD